MRKGGQMCGIEEMEGRDNDREKVVGGERERLRGRKGGRGSCHRPNVPHPPDHNSAHKEPDDQSPQPSHQDILLSRYPFHDGYPRRHKFPFSRTLRGSSCAGRGGRGWPGVRYPNSCPRDYSTPGHPLLPPRPSLHPGRT